MSIEKFFPRTKLRLKKNLKSKSKFQKKNLDPKQIPEPKFKKKKKLRLEKIWSLSSKKKALDSKKFWSVSSKKNLDSKKSGIQKKKT